MMTYQIMIIIIWLGFVLFFTHFNYRLNETTFHIYSYQCLKCDAYYETRIKSKLGLLGIYHKIKCRWI